MPFVTEEIYGQISEGTIVTAEYPVVRPEFENEEAAAGVEALKDVIRSVRNSRAGSERSSKQTNHYLD